MTLVFPKAIRKSYVIITCKVDLSHVTSCAKPMAEAILEQIEENHMLICVLTWISAFVKQQLHNLLKAYK